MRDRVTGVLAWAQVAISRLHGGAQAGVVRLQHGQGLAEYALILALIAIVAIIALIFLGGQVSKILSTVGKSV
jgi:Flp pilus assembly pilin Flp